ncbi:TIGR00341 family protein [Catenovulum sediminis]|uniref:TIGR00341 family protein n=2 Tax=Catenovulum sediminis TaxID=1740262 RepID=A0ABV1RD89_9ALTE
MSNTPQPDTANLQTIFLIQQGTAEDMELALVESQLKHHPVTLVQVQDILSGATRLNENDYCLLYLSDELNAQTIPLLSSYKCIVSILPHPEGGQSIIGFGLHSELNEAIQDSLSCPMHAVDILKCNNELVLNSVDIGEFAGFKPVRMPRSGVFSRITNFCRRWKKIRHQVPFQVTLTTQKGKTITTAATAISVIEHASNARFVQQLIGDSNINDGMFHAVFLAPRSLRQLFIGMLKNIFNPPINMPDFIGHIRSAGMEVTTSKPIEYKIDDRLKLDNKLIFSIENRVLNLVPGRYLKIEKSALQSKEIFRTQNLPADDAVAELVSNTLPWNIHAGTEEFRDLYQSLRENAAASASFLTLMTLSTMLATLGLFANSAPVIIGAMILAPLMAPIVSFSMGTVRQDQDLMAQASKTLIYGLCLALFAGAFIALLIPLHVQTAEMMARVSPNLLDLGVAIISGIAAAYANSRAEIAKSLAGVAIAVALVPPLATTGVALAWLNLDMMTGSFLLFLTNLSGIVLAAAITFSWLGFSPFKRAQKGLIAPILITAVISVPLAVSFVNMVQNNTTINKIISVELDNAQINNVEIISSKPMLIKFDLIVARYPTENMIKNVKSALKNKLKTEFEMEITVVIRR